MRLRQSPPPRGWCNGAGAEPETVFRRARADWSKLFRRKMAASACTEAASSSIRRLVLLVSSSSYIPVVLA